MAFTAGFSVNVGDPTKASDVDVLAANDDYLKNAIDTFIANDANNRVLTATGSGTANAETNLTFDGSTLTVTGTVSATTFSGNVTGGTISGTTGTFSGDVAVNTSTLKVDTSNNRVGVKNASPSYPLDIGYTAGINQVAWRGSTNEIGFLTFGSSTDAGAVQLSSGGATKILFDAAGNSYIHTGSNFGIGTSSASAPLHIIGSDGDPSASHSGDAQLILENNGTTFFEIATGATHYAGMTFSDGTATRGAVVYDHGTALGGGADSLHFQTAGSIRAVLDASGNMGLGVVPSTWRSTETALQVDRRAALYADSHVTTALANNLIINSGGYALIEADAASQYYQYQGAHVWQTVGSGSAGASVSPSTVMSLTSAGLLGIGTSSPSAPLDVDLAGGSNYIAHFRNQTAGTPYGVHIDEPSSATVDYPLLNVGTVATPRFRVFSGASQTDLTDDGLTINGGGIYQIGSSLKYIASSSVQSISSTNNAGAELTTDAYLWINRSSAPCVFLNRTTTTGQIVVFYSDLTPVGSISVTASATAYNTSSDYRLKENLAPITGAVDRVNALQPRRFNFIAEPDKVVDGFVAHEVSDIVPEAITGEKDAVDADGNPEYQGIDQSKLVPLLTAAIQELTLTTQQLTARIEALEAA